MPIFVKASRRAKAHVRKSSIYTVHRTSRTIDRVFKGAMSRGRTMSPGRMGELQSTMNSLTKTQTDALRTFHEKAAYGRKVLKKTRHHLSFMWKR